MLWTWIPHQGHCIWHLMAGVLMSLLSQKEAIFPLALGHFRNLMKSHHVSWCQRWGTEIAWNMLGMPKSCTSVCERIGYPGTPKTLCVSIYVFIPSFPPMAMFEETHSRVPLRILAGWPGSCRHLPGAAHRVILGRWPPRMSQWWKSNGHS